MGEPCAVVYGNALHLYFTAVGASAKFGTSLQVIGLVTTADGVTWSIDGWVGEASWQQIRLHHATSADGRTGWTQDPAPIASAGDFTWAVDEIRAPHAFVDDTTLKLFFAGHELDGTAPEHFAIGVMTAPLLAP